MTDGRPDRVELMRAMVERAPDDMRARYFLAHELARREDWAGAAEQYRIYVEGEPTEEGAAFRAWGQCLERLGRTGEAADAYRRGIERALLHGHAGLAGEIRFLLEALEEEP